MSTVAAAPVYPKAYRHPLKFVREHAQVLLYAALGAYIGMLIVVAAYYLLFETTATMNNWWHSTVPNSDLRHTIRDVGEALLGGLLGKQMAYNEFSKKRQRKLAKPPGIIDRIEIALHIPNPKDGKPFSVAQLLATPFLVLLYAVPGLWMGFTLVNWVHGLHLHIAMPVSTNPTTTGLASKMTATFSADWPKKLVGYFAAFVFGMRPARGMFGDVQQIIAEQWVAYGRSPAWWMPAPFRARVAQAEQVAIYSGDQTHGTLIKRLVIGGAVFCLGMAVFGWYVLAFIA